VCAGTRDRENDREIERMKRSVPAREIERMKQWRQRTAVQRESISGRSGERTSGRRQLVAGDN